MTETPTKDVPESRFEGEPGHMLSRRVLAELAGVARDTAARKLRVLQHVDGPAGARLYDSRIALPVLIGALRVE